MIENKKLLSDEDLDLVTGGTNLSPLDDGFQVGDRVLLRTSTIQYCNYCARLINGTTATITGFRGVLDGQNIWWIQRDCCARAKTSEISSAFRHL